MSAKKTPSGTKPKGRPTRLTPDVHAALVEALTTGCYRETAARAAGIGVSTLYRWLEQGEADIEHDKATPHRELREALEKAEADAEQTALKIIRAAAPKNWQAAAWMLERKNPDRWGRRDAMKVEHSGSVKTDLSKLTDSQLQELAEGLDSRRAGAR